MCNTRSKVYLQSMKTYILSVNTLTWNLTSEHHNNCAPCLGLILPIRWVTPPPIFLEDLCLASYCIIFKVGLSSTLVYLHGLSSQCLSWSSLPIYIYIHI